MNAEMTTKLNELTDTIKEAVVEIKKNSDDADELNSVVKEGRDAVTWMLEQQMGNVSLEEQINISELDNEEWLITVRHVIDAANDPFIPRNKYDGYFFQLFSFLINNSKETILSNIKCALMKMKEKSPQDYNDFVEYFSRFQLWGTLDPLNNDLNTLELRANVLKHHAYDFLWLYRKTEDYMSKRTLAAILINWLDLQTEHLKTVKSIFFDYWEPDIFPDNNNDVMVDVGAFTGDSIQNYVYVYGTGYKKIYAYEISDETYKELCSNIDAMSLHDVDIRKKGAGAEKTTMYVSSNKDDASANKLVDIVDDGSEVEIVRLDDDLDDIPTLIKMDIEGAEQGALIGCERIIREHHPKLAICVYHGYDDLWKIPSMISEMYPEYKFYLRYNGGDLIPTEFVLLCRDK